MAADHRLTGLYLTSGARNVHSVVHETSESCFVFSLGLFKQLSVITTCAQVEHTGGTK